MAEVQQILPTRARLAPQGLVASVRSSTASLKPFGPEILEMITDLSRALRKDPDLRERPAVGALAYWIRPAGLERLRSHWAALCTVNGAVRVPRGVAFHIPPTNVDTLFVYSWLISALVGNANIIRLSSAAADGGGRLLEVLNQVLARHPAIAQSTAVVTYGHEDEVTAALSAADLRVIWGGDDAVARIRSIPASPRTVDVAFPNRFSFAVLDAAATLSIDPAGLHGLIDRFINDAYWFDQLGCASPRLVIWRGEPSTSEAASGRFFDALRTRIDSDRWGASASTVMAKLVWSSVAAADGAVARVRWVDPDATVARLDSLASLPRETPGGGFFLEAHISRLDDIAHFVAPSDQTLTHFGVSRDELTLLAASGSLRGIDRMVPVGQALSFSHLWDGYDLFSAFSRLLVVDASDSVAGWAR